MFCYGICFLSQSTRLSILVSCETGLQIAHFLTSHFIKQFRWVPQQWSSCSRECDGGKQRRDIYCMQKTDKDGDKRVKNKYCRGKRPPKTRRCNLRPCQPQWSEGTWSEVSISDNMMSCYSTPQK